MDMCLPLAEISLEFHIVVYRHQLFSLNWLITGNNRLYLTAQQMETNFWLNVSLMQHMRVNYSIRFSGCCIQYLDGRVDFLQSRFKHFWVRVVWSYTRETMLISQLHKDVAEPKLQYSVMCTLITYCNPMENHRSHIIAHIWEASVYTVMGARCSCFLFWECMCICVPDGSLYYQHIATYWWPYREKPSEIVKKAPASMAACNLAELIHHYSNTRRASWGASGMDPEKD